MINFLQIASNAVMVIPLPSVDCIELGGPARPGPALPDRVPTLRAATPPHCSFCSAPVGSRSTATARVTRIRYSGPNFNEEQLIEFAYCLQNLHSKVAGAPLSRCARAPPRPSPPRAAPPCPPVNSAHQHSDHNALAVPLVNSVGRRRRGSRPGLLYALRVSIRWTVWFLRQAGLFTCVSMAHGERSSAFVACVPATSRLAAGGLLITASLTD